MGRLSSRGSLKAEEKDVTIVEKQRGEMFVSKGGEREPEAKAPGDL